MSPADLREQCATALLSTNLRAFLDVIRAGEGTSDADGYRRHYGGRLFDSFADHPRIAIKAGQWTSTAAGAYQFLSRTWDECAKALALPDFSPASQDLAAVFLIRRRGALADAMAGRLDVAIAKCAREWASLPDSPYGQPTRTREQAHATYAAAGGRLTSTDSAPDVVQTDETADVRTDHAQAAPAAPLPEPAAPEPTKEHHMPIPAIVGALLPVLTSAVPELVKLIRPDSKAAEKNATIAAKAFEVAQAALGAANAQDVAERIQSDPQAAQAVRQAVREQWFSLSDLTQLHEADEDSRAAAALRASAEPWDMTRTLVYGMGAFLLLLVGLVFTVAVVQINTTGAIASEVWAQVAGLIGFATGIGVTVFAYRFGTSRSSAAKDVLIDSLSKR